MVEEMVVVIVDQDIEDHAPKKFFEITAQCSYIAESPHGHGNIGIGPLSRIVRSDQCSR
jgi:hypothetical protein